MTELHYFPLTVSAWGAASCLADVREGQTHLVTCTEVGYEGIWSPQEAGTFEAMQAEHDLAHHEAVKAREQRMMAETARLNAWHIYRTTEPGHPARRGIGANLY